LQRSLRDVLSGGHPIDMALSARLEQLHAAGTIDTAELVRLRGLLLEQPYAPYPDLPTRRDIARLKAEVDRLTELVEILLRQRE
ncbi:MAG TPA: pesticidal protein Cry15Aa, partial [Roseiflexaceae bacterium]|nr:pesticidal protein Cry15Aa [Roseiflexaceae bacterium]